MDALKSPLANLDFYRSTCGKTRKSIMRCPHCKEEMDYEDGIHQWNVRTYYCAECDYEQDYDITGDLIDNAENEYSDR